ncbi:protein kinase [Trypanosoma grayi]|uniref:protein kinase n=1 Tax=Trypanosoma grayi TaxID=71804 RepID=UPI0004F4824B|nr:protein kinase [Trypanosoma grayi]KEG12599.1 protein kinase [Trypanosoma grayi]
MYGGENREKRTKASRPTKDSIITRREAQSTSPHVTFVCDSEGAETSVRHSKSSDVHCGGVRLFSDETVNAVVPNSTPVESFNGAGANYWRNMDNMVVDRLSLSMDDISVMRLRGCRATGLSQGCCGASVSTSYVLPPSLYASPFEQLLDIGALRGCYSYHDTGNTILNGGEDSVDNLAAAAAAVDATVTMHDVGVEMANDNDKNNNIHDDGDTPCGVRGDRGVQTPGLKLGCAPRIFSEALSSLHLENHDNLDAMISQRPGKNAVTPPASSRPSTTSSKNHTPAFQPFSSWKFPVLGKVDSAPAVSLQRADLIGEGEKGAWHNGFQKEVNAAAAAGGGGGGGIPGARCGAVNCSDNGDRCGYGAGGDDDDGDNDKSVSLLEGQEYQGYKKRLRFMYAIYERHALQEGRINNNINISQRDTNRNGSNALALHTSLQCPSPTFTTTWVPSGYYSLGTRCSIHHPNKQVVPVVSPLLNSLMSRQRDECPRSCTVVMDPSIVALIERRPVLQTTIFASHTYRQLRRQIKQQKLQSSGERGYGPDATPFLPHVEDSTRQQDMCSGGVAGGISNVAAREKSPLKKLWATERARRLNSKVATGTTPVAAATVAAGETSSAEPAAVPLMSREEPPNLVHHRVLTQVNSWNSKVHTIDGINRQVDNEADDLVVYVGMTLMGWLEVVDLLGAGTFGQVFLCKDLRIANGCFMHPMEIEGEDFQYWQCSHEYIPFSDPSIMPTHPSLVAVKVVKSRALFEQQSVLEAEMLVCIGAQTPSQKDHGPLQNEGFGAAVHTTEPPQVDPRCNYVAKVYAHGICYGHHCIVMERYGANLFEYVQSRGFKGLPMYYIQTIGKKILLALTLLHDECRVVHCDIKPENVLLTLDSCISTVTIHGSGGPVGSNGSGAKATLEASGVLLASSVRKPCLSTRLEASMSNTIDVPLPAPLPLRLHRAVPLEKVHDKTRRGETNTDGEGIGDGGPREVPSGSVIPPLHIKLIDFSSSAYVGGCVYTYVQSRYYRAPEVIIGAGYGPPIDVWSTGCFLAELLLGLPLLPGSCDYHQLYLMEEMLGPLPTSLLAQGRLTHDYYDAEDAEPERESTASGSSTLLKTKTKGQSSFRLLREEEYRARHGQKQPVEWRCYFQYHTLAELVRRCMLTAEEKRMAIGCSPIASVGDISEEEVEQQKPIKTILDEMMQQRLWLYDLLKKMLHGDPSKRPTAREALAHSFFTHTPEYAKPYLPLPE